MSNPIRDALELAVKTMRAPLDEWKGELERKALDVARAALAANEQEAQSVQEPLTAEQVFANDEFMHLNGSLLLLSIDQLMLLVRAVERAHRIGKPKP